MSNSEQEESTGLYKKYEVRKDGEPVEDCFILKPRTDEAARRAIETYIEKTENDEFADDLRSWLAAIEIEEAEWNDD